MLQWFFDRIWSTERTTSESGGQLEAARYTLHKGKRYQAVVVLTGFETWAGNETVARKLEEVGFKSVKVTGSGDRRTAEGLWSKSDVTADVDPHLTHIMELA